MIRVEWRGGLRFEAKTPAGITFTMDDSDLGSAAHGPSPIEALVASAAGCSAMDVISILKKKRQDVREYRVEVEWTRGPEGERPRPVTSVLLRHIVSGQNIDPAAVKHAVELSDEKYCSVVATLRQPPTVTSEFRIE
jgi:putative redox protein